MNWAYHNWYWDNRDKLQARAEREASQDKILREHQVKLDEIERHLAIMGSISYETFKQICEEEYE